MLKPSLEYRLLFPDWKTKFNPDQPRNPHTGEWVEVLAPDLGGGGGGAGASEDWVSKFPDQEFHDSEEVRREQEGQVRASLRMVQRARSVRDRRAYERFHERTKQALAEIEQAIAGGRRFPKLKEGQVWRKPDGQRVQVSAVSGGGQIYIQRLKADGTPYKNDRQVTVSVLGSLDWVRER